MIFYLNIRAYFIFYLFYFILLGTVTKDKIQHYNDNIKSKIKLKMSLNDNCAQHCLIIYTLSLTKLKEKCIIYFVIVPTIILLTVHTY